MAARRDAVHNISDEKVKKLMEKFVDLKQKIILEGLDPDNFLSIRLKCRQRLKSRRKSRFWSSSMRLLLLFALPVFLGVLIYVVSIFIQDITINQLSDTKCLLYNNVLFKELSRPIASCEFCNGVKSIFVLSSDNISSEEFTQKYAYSGRPILVKGATRNWTAMHNFSFNFFRKIYRETEGALRSVQLECQFFPYKTEFNTLEEALNMSDERASLKENQRPWYIGWSNCHPGTAELLREHYTKPHFLPQNSESSITDWIFMGGPGPGASTHLDYIQRPSWQAQISGKKSWLLFPPPECENVCHLINMTAEKGDIVLIDTNLWYHNTSIHPGEISITIGSEYD